MAENHLDLFVNCGSPRDREEPSVMCCCLGRRVVAGFMGRQSMPCHAGPWGKPARARRPNIGLPSTSALHSRPPLENNRHRAYLCGLPTSTGCVLATNREYGLVLSTTDKRRIVARHLASAPQTPATWKCCRSGSTCTDSPPKRAVDPWFNRRGTERPLCSSHTAA
jgi:hypothetical protein